MKNEKNFINNCSYICFENYNIYNIEENNCIIIDFKVKNITISDESYELYDDLEYEINTVNDN